MIYNYPKLPVIPAEINGPLGRFLGSRHTSSRLVFGSLGKLTAHPERKGKRLPFATIVQGRYVLVLRRVTVGWENIETVTAVVVEK